MSNGQRVGRVAVIAVHGVADQQPSESAEALGTILLTVEGTGTEGFSAYEPFQSRVIHVPLEPVLATPYIEPKRAGARKRDGAYDDGLAFMRKLLGRYKPAGKRSYLTNRLEGRRRKHPASHAPTAECEVDIYEMYWADLSRLGSDPFRVFGSIYHLLLHLSELGMLALQGGLQEFRNKRWRVLVNLQRVAVKFLTLWIPILNLLALFTLAGAVLVRVVGGSVTRSLENPKDPAAPLVIDENAFSNSMALKVAAVAGITLIIVGITYAAASKWLPAKFRGWWLVPVGALTATATLAWVLLRRTQHADVVLVFECWIVGFVLFDFLLRKYEGVIQRARRAGWALYALVFGTFIWALVVASRDARFHPREVEYASLWTLQMLNVALSAGWIVLVVCAVLAALLG